MFGNFLRMLRRETSWVAVWACTVWECHFLWALPIVPTPPLPVHLANDSRPGPEIIQRCDGLLDCAEEKLWVNSEQRVLFVLQLG